MPLQEGLDGFIDITHNAKRRKQAMRISSALQHPADSVKIR
ncbi:MAG: hypothetical protein ACJA2P_001437 [Rhodoferax sp.]|jgi:hypothetical protein